MPPIRSIDMLFEAFKNRRRKTPRLAAFLVSSGDRSVPITWKRFTDDIATVCWIIDRHPGHTRIAILGENSYEWMVAHAACLFSGAIAIPVEPALSPSEIARRMKFAGATVLLHSSLYTEKAHDVAKIEPDIATGGFGTRKTDYFIASALSALGLAKKNVWRRHSVDTERTATFVFTSGTTSEPRAVELDIRAIETFVESTSAALEMNEGDRSLMLLPLHHIFGIAATYTMLVRGVSLGVCPDFRRVYDAAERFKIDFLFIVPALADILAAKIEHRGKSAKEALGQAIKWILTGGAPLSRKTYERLSALGIKTISGYGLTETAACYSMAWSRGIVKPESAGRIPSVKGVETKVSPEGELLVRGPNVMKGYYKMPERTAKAIDKDGWFHTGDKGFIDEDGFVFVKGRLSRTIILSSGKKVSPEELEAKLLEIPGVLEAMVSGEGESRDIHAEIYAPGGENGVRAAVTALNANLPVYQRIRRIEFRPDPFPRTASGKIKLK